MVQPLQAFFKEAFLISTIPFLTKGVALFLGSLKGTRFYQSSHQDQNPSEFGDYHFISWIYDQLISNNVYSDYRVFIVTMIFLTLLVAGIKRTYQYYQLSPHQQKLTIGSHPREIPSLKELKAFSGKETLYSCGKLVICYTLIFSIVQLVSSIISIYNPFFNNEFVLGNNNILTLWLFSLIYICI